MHYFEKVLFNTGEFIYLLISLFIYLQLFFSFHIDSRLILLFFRCRLVNYLSLLKSHSSQACGHLDFMVPFSFGGISDQLVTPFGGKRRGRGRGREREAS